MRCDPTKDWILAKALRLAGEASYHSSIIAEAANFSILN